MKRRRFLQAAAAGAAVAATRTWGATTDKRPNFLLIVADDMGWADVGCFGRDDVRTPTIDSLARDGMKFEQGYANSCVCTPSRVAMATGRYQNRLPIGQEEPLTAKREQIGLDPKEPTLASQLKAAGYQTSLVGKWHLGRLDQFSPLKNGYQHFWGLRGGGVDYFTHADTTKGNPKPDTWDGDVQVTEAGYMTDLIGKHASDEVKRMGAGSAPFLLSLHFTAPHWPWEGPKDSAVPASLAELAHHDGGTIATYRQMIESLDANIAKVLAALEATGRARDTLVIFTSDNGGERFAKTWPFNGMKGELLEGGIRVPLLARWPARIRAGSVSQQVAITMDFLPTFLAAAGVQPDTSRPPDGMSLLKAFDDPRLVTDRTLFWRFKAQGQAAARRGQYKYLRIKGAEYLFDVVADPQERGNLNVRQAAVFEALKKDWAKWNSEMLAYVPESSTYDLTAPQVFPDRY